MNIDTEREPNQQVIVPLSVSRRDNHGAGSCSGPILIKMLEQDAKDSTPTSGCGLSLPNDNNQKVPMNSRLLTTAAWQIEHSKHRTDGFTFL
jgi:hypothetical protein